MADAVPLRPTAVVTGASRGIGRAIARRLAAEFQIVAVARSEGELRSLAAEIQQGGGTCAVVPLDIGDAGAVERALGAVEADVLVNNAGVGVMKPLLDLSLDEWRTMVDVNFNALFYVTRTLLPGMIRRGGGHVVTIGSLAGRHSFVGGTCYAATKHAVIGFTESLMLEVRDRNVRVSVVMPGSVATDLRSGADLLPGSRDTSWMMTADDVAEAVAFTVTRGANVHVSRVEMRPSRPPKRGM